MGITQKEDGKFVFSDECELQKYLVSDPVKDFFSIDAIDKVCLQEIANKFAISFEKVYRKICEQHGDSITFQRFEAAKAYTRYLDSLTIFRSHHAPKSARPNIFKISGRITYWLMKKPVLASSDPINISVNGLNEIFALSVGIGMVNEYLAKQNRRKIKVNKGFRKRILHEFTDHAEMSETALALLFEAMAISSNETD
jgi:hypothetical protein